MNGKVKRQSIHRTPINPQLYAMCRAGTDPAIDIALETPLEKLSRLLAVSDVMDRFREAFTGDPADPEAEQ